MRVWVWGKKESLWECVCVCVYIFFLLLIRLQNVYENLWKSFTVCGKLVLAFCIVCIYILLNVSCVCIFFWNFYIALHCIQYVNTLVPKVWKKFSQKCNIKIKSARVQNHCIYTINGIWYILFYTVLIWKSLHFCLSVLFFGLFEFQSMQLKINMAVRFLRPFIIAIVLLLFLLVFFLSFRKCEKKTDDAF